MSKKHDFDRPDRFGICEKCGCFADDEEAHYECNPKFRLDIFIIKVALGLYALGALYYIASLMEWW